MNIVCVICTDLLTSSSNIYHTPCGHIFHYACLDRWLQREYYMKLHRLVLEKIYNPTKENTDDPHIFSTCPPTKELTTSNSQTCPQCRGQTSLNRIQRVYFNFADDDMEDASTLQNRIDRLRAELNSKDRDAKLLSKKCGTLEYTTKNLKKKLKEKDMERMKIVHNLKMEADVKMVEVNTVRRENDQLRAPIEACRKYITIFVLALCNRLLN